MGVRVICLFCAIVAAWQRASQQVFLVNLFTPVLHSVVALCWHMTWISCKGLFWQHFTLHCKSFLLHLLLFLMHWEDVWASWEAPEVLLVTNYCWRWRPKVSWQLSHVVFVVRTTCMLPQNEKVKHLQHAIQKLYNVCNDLYRVRWYDDDIDWWDNMNVTLNRLSLNISSCRCCKSMSRTSL